MGNKAYLFLDWNHVESGRRKASLNKERFDMGDKETIIHLEHEIGDNYDIENKGYKRVRLPYGIYLEIEEAELSDPWLVPDEKNSEKLINHLTVIKEDDRYRCWYYTNFYHDDSQMSFKDKKRIPNVGVISYCESKDGFNWKRPEFGEYPRNGHKTNIVSEWCSCGAVFNDNVYPETGKYKSFNLYECEDGTHGLISVKSRDGYHWEPIYTKLIKGYRDTQNVITWDEAHKCYVAYLRDNRYGRSIARSVSKDFFNWSEPEVILTPEPMDNPDVDYYTSGFTFYPGETGLGLIFCAIYNHGSDNMDIRLAVSHDNHLFNWISYEPVISMEAAGSKFGGCIYACPNLVHLPDGRLALPCNWTNYHHEEEYCHHFYKKYTKKLTGVCWAVWEDGRLAGIKTKNVGEFYTKKFFFDGSGIQINAKTWGAGSIMAEILEDGKAVNGFTLEDGKRFSGNEVWSEYNWSGNVLSLNKHNIQIRFVLENAKIYGFRII